MKLIATWVIVFLFFAVSFFLVGQNVLNFRASILPTKQHKPFDGTAAPVQKVPNWVKFSSSEWKLNYEQIPAEKLISLPKYDAERLKTPIESLVWGNAAHDAIRNEKITYSVPYMGAYDLKNIENSGGHLAVDLKLPNNTPIFVIANGIVVKVALQTTGFGKHIVMKHENVSSLEDPNKKVTLYSSYNHLNDVFVSEGDIVDKGQQIGLSGATGIATTPHLHFQIDNENAPWHPYWPFTYQEATASGLDFLGAVNAGLGREKALANTINPLVYVQKYLNYSTSSSSSSSTSSTSGSPSSSSSSSSESSTLPSNSSSSSSSSLTDTQPAKEPSNFTFTHQTIFARTETPTFLITALDENGNPLSTFPDSVTLSVTNNVGLPLPEVLGAGQFVGGQATVALQNLNIGYGQLVAVYKGKTFNSQRFEILSEASRAKKFVISHDGSFFLEEPELITMQVVDDQNQPVANFAQSGVVNVALSRGNASLSTASIDVASFAGGEATIRIKPKTKEDIIVRVWYEGLNGESVPLRYALFDDVVKGDSHYNAIRYLKKRNVIQGYPDGTFKPSQTVSRVEALKLIYEGTGKKPVESASLPFKDTSKTEWYARYVASAVFEKIVQGYADRTFKPANTVNRAEFLKMLVLAMGIDINPVVTEKPYPDVAIDAWYAPYVQFAKEKNIVFSEGENINPTAGMTRAEVAEAVFRVMVLKEKVADSFSEGLVAEADL